jgi:hypothetical protein
MQNLRRFSRSFLSSSIGLGLAAAALVAGAAGCSSNAATADAGAADACTALAACCTGIGGAGESTCQSFVTAARAANSESSCATTLQSYTQSGLCGGLDSGEPASDFDANLPCALTNTCGGDTGDAGNVDTVVDSGLFGAGVHCEYLGTCSSGGAEYDTCTETLDGGACVAAIVFPTTGTSILCASCLDCAAASASAASQCPNVTQPVDAGPDCGTPPALHPETDAGVYCPFAAAGAIHCNAGQECCEAPTAASGDSTCQAAGAACPITGSLAWQCDGPVDCAGSADGPICCAAGTVANDAVCGYERGSAFPGSHCAQSCVTGEVSLCTTTSDPCTAGGVCTPFKVAGVVLGTCL